MDATERRQCLVPANISARRANWEGFDSGRDPLAAARNNAGMAEIPFIDTHFHLHDMKRPELRYSWLERDAIHGFLGNIDALKAQHYWIDDYLAEIRFANVPKAIHVQAALGTPDPVNETKWLQAFADKTGYPADMLDMTGQIGVVAPGAYADIVAVNGDPLHDIDVLGAVTFVMKDGGVFKNEVK